MFKVSQLHKSRLIWMVNTWSVTAEDYGFCRDGALAAQTTDLLKELPPACN